MIVPQYWAESRAKHRDRNRQVTVRRFGWSDVSQEEAQTHADQRAAEALQRILSGERLHTHDPKVPYNGADGIPIREEILSRHGETVVTRNSYGAHCLNTPNVLFADIDFEQGPGCRLALSVFVVLLAFAILAGWLAESRLVGAIAGFLALACSQLIATAIYRIRVQLQGGTLAAARKRITAFVDKHPSWNLVVYQTPAGLRVLATHQTFEPRDSVVTEFFTALETDPIYVRMCYNQQCFRARVSPKPWRIGIEQHMKPRPGVWPVAPERLPARNAWIEQYEVAASDYAACRYLETMGSGVEHADARYVRELHDELSSAKSGLPIA